MFIDDTGNLHENVSNNPAKRYGGITGVILKDTYLRETFNPGFAQIVEETFGRGPDKRLPNIHRRSLSAPPKEGPLARLNDDAVRKEWNRKCLGMFYKADYHVITVGIDKIAYYFKNPTWQGNFYEIAIRYAIERYFYYLKSLDAVGDVTVEQKDPVADEKISVGFRRAMENGFDFIVATALSKRFSSKELKIASKKDGLPGLQLADLVAKPAFDHCYKLHIDTSAELKGMGADIAGMLEQSKFYRDRNGNPHGYGRIWRP